MSTRTRSALRRGLVVVGVTGGAAALGIALGAGTASADETTSGQDGHLSGNQVTVIGDSNTQQESTTGPGSSGAGEAPAPPGTTGEDGVASGNQSAVQVEAPVDASGNQVTVIGDGNESAGAVGPGAAG